MQPLQPKRRKPDYDQAFKRLLRRGHAGFLALVAPGLVWRGERSPEFPAVRRQADLVWEVQTPEGERSLLHVELQTEPDTQIGARIADYKIQLWQRDHLPIQSVVVFLRPASNIQPSPFVIPWRQGTSLQSDYAIIKLWEIPVERVLATPAYDLWPLAALMAGVTVERVVAVDEQIAAAPLPQAERSELTGLLVVLSELRLRRWKTLQALRRNPMIDELVRQSSLFEEAKLEGKLEGKREAIQLMLEARFGTLSADMLAALGAADDAALEGLARHAATETLEQIRARLGLP